MLVCFVYNTSCLSLIFFKDLLCQIFVNKNAALYYTHLWNESAVSFLSAKNEQPFHINEREKWNCVKISLLCTSGDKCFHSFSLFLSSLINFICNFFKWSHLFLKLNFCLFLILSSSVPVLIQCFCLFVCLFIAVLSSGFCVKFFLCLSFFVF